MSLVKSSTYAPDIYNSLRGILLLHKPAGLHPSALINTVKELISDQLNQYEPRPLAKRLMITGEYHQEKKLTEVPNLADHPLVVGPRYNPWNIRIFPPGPHLSTRSSGVTPMILGDDIRYYINKFKRAHIVSVYHITGEFGYTTDNMFSDGKIIDKATFKHIKLSKIDNILCRIEGTQRDRLFETSSVPLDSQEAYELAKSWPSRPLRMARWPIIYRLRCIHLALPEFKIEVTVTGENEPYLAQLSQDIGMALKSSAYTKSIRRVKFGMFDISDSLSSSEWDLQSVVNNLKIHADYRKVHDYFNRLRREVHVREEHDVTSLRQNMVQKQDR